jgi:hypothetical protein
VVRIRPGLFLGAAAGTYIYQVEIFIRRPNLIFIAGPAHVLRSGSVVRPIIPAFRAEDPGSNPGRSIFPCPPPGRGSNFCITLRPIWPDLAGIVPGHRISRGISRQPSCEMGRYGGLGQSSSGYDYPFRAPLRAHNSLDGIDPLPPTPCGFLVISGGSHATAGQIIPFTFYFLGNCSSAIGDSSLLCSTCLYSINPQVNAVPEQNTQIAVENHEIRYPTPLRVA